MESKVIIGLTPNSPEWKRAMQNANNAADPKLNIPNWKRNKVKKMGRG